MELKDFTLILTKAAICLNFNLSEQHIIAWYEMFFNETKEDFQTALKTVIKQPQRKFFPTVPEVSAALELLKKGEQLSAAEAWHKVTTYAQQSIEEHEVEKLESKNPILLNAMRQIEYRKIRYANIDTELPFLKAAFIKAYNSKLTDRQELDRLAITQSETSMLQTLGLSKRLSIG